MKPTILDTYTTMREVLRAPETERAALLERMWRPAEGAFRYFPGPVDLAAMHAAAFGFPIDRDIDECLDAVDLLHDANAWDRIEAALSHAATVLKDAVPGLVVPDVTVMLTVGDPSDTVFVDDALGLSANGSVTGYLLINVWPTPENLARLEATAVHELHHNVRYAPGGVVWDPATVTVGEQVVSEGLADAFARQLYGDDLGASRIGVAHRHDDEVFATVVEALDVTGMENFASWVLGDAIAGRFGAPPRGVPTGAGYAVGNRLVDAYLTRTGTPAAQAVRVDARDVIAASVGG